MAISIVRNSDGAPRWQRVQVRLIPIVPKSSSAQVFHSARAFMDYSISFARDGSKGITIPLRYRRATGGFRSPARPILRKPFYCQGDSHMSSNALYLPLHESDMYKHLRRPPFRSQQTAFESTKEFPSTSPADV